MSIDLERINRLISFVNSCINMNPDTQLSEEVLDQYIALASQMFNIQYTELELSTAKKDLMYRHQIYYTSPGESILSNYDEKNWYTEAKANNEINPVFWARYKAYLIDEKHFSPNIVSTLGNETLDKDIMNYIGNPKSANDFFKRGLIIGDVQSGKTSTYIGLMCKAADAGYKVFILLTGTIENLRKQTQERVEEGFIGIDMSSNKAVGNRVGVGLDNKDILAASFTSRKNDFVGNSDQISVSLRDNNAVVFVIKKNSSVLTKLVNWLKKATADVLTGKIDAPMLLIDDEADNASINTSSSKEDPTKINKLIRELASMFTKSNYVGFTATPYANVFIDPITTEEMLHHDLFPEDFIYALPTPNNYIGAQQTFNKEGKYFNQINYITDAGEVETDGFSFYFKHKKTWEGELPESLTDAIYTFYLANAIRDIRGQIRTHRSMLLNLSRFVRVQYYIKDCVSAIHDRAYRSIKYNLNAQDFNASMQDPVIKRLYGIWKDQYSNIEFISWEDIASALYFAIEDIQIKVVNSTQKKDKLVYSDELPIRVIAIGGLALSRGLTLEGLMVSYFFRNTSTYDVLMQMGRWFGYRKGYDDLFRIWTHPDSARWYAEIAESTDILKKDMHDMHDKELTPKTFGIRVRDDCNELQITAPNKRRNAIDEYEFSGYAGKIVETPYLSSDAAINKKNYYILEEEIQGLLQNGFSFEKMHGSGEHYVICNVNKSFILDLLNQMYISRFNHEFDKLQLIDYISTELDGYIDKWDIAFMDGEQKNAYVDFLGKKIVKIKRNTCSIDGEKLKTGRKGKLGGPSDGKIGIVDNEELTREDIIYNAQEEFKKHFKKEKGYDFSKGRQYPSDTWFKYIKDRNPLLLVYFIDVASENKSVAIDNYNQEMVDEEKGIIIPSIGIAVGFPKNDNVNRFSKKKYKANKTYNYFEIDELEQESEEE